MRRPPLPTVTLRGIEFHSLTETQCVEHILDEIDASRGGWVITANVDHVRRCQKDPEYREFVRLAEVVVADGMPVVWASRLQGDPLPERVAGSSLVGTLIAGAATRGRSVFFLGGPPGTADGAAEKLGGLNPDLRVAGTRCPPFGFEEDVAEMRRIEVALRSSRPDIVFVALGSPKQERLISRLRGALPSAWWIGVGAAFSFYSGHITRAPEWMQRTGLEWLHRLWKEPRLARRYLVDGIPFAIRLFAGSAAERWRKSTRTRSRRRH